MQVDILRGKDHIGGNIIKVTDGETAILLDCGAMLPEIDQPKVEDTFDISRIGKVAAIFLSHHHGDHAGLLEKLPPEVDLFTSAETKTFMDLVDTFLGKPLRTIGRNIHILSDNQSVKVGSFEVTPVGVKHSAEGSIMFIVRSGGKGILYTGDYKTTEGFKTSGIDLMITEGTMLTRNGQAYPDEEAVEIALKKVMTETKGRIFVLQSSANIPRIHSIANANVNSRPLMQDVFLRYILEGMGHKVLISRYAFVWHRFSVNTEKPCDLLAKRLHDSREASTFGAIAKLPQAIVFLRSSMLSAMKKLINNGINISNDAFIFSIWRGYEKDPKTAALLKLFAEHGVLPQYIHTSGHADKRQIQELIQNVNPARIACVHSEDTSMISEIVGNILVEKGERIVL
ncbi:Ribonuclease J [bioreactor metagenome]|uniref:Ribonuclease J n=1 Tax=bioreactor metagenome TaxID=1076179 RepID=A0A644YJZ0_9ZZZZ